MGAGRMRINLNTSYTSSGIASNISPFSAVICVILLAASVTDNKTPELFLSCLLGSFVVTETDILSYKVRKDP